jgi:hypothetical protein
VAKSQDVGAPLPTLTERTSPGPRRCEGSLSPLRSAERVGFAGVPQLAGNSQVLGFACAPAVFPKAVLARARKVVLKDWRRLARPRCARQGKTGAVRRADVSVTSSVDVGIGSSRAKAAPHRHA